ncbi:thioredoxin family protein [Marinilabiliaceae bacterium ANBcel2]|nr:thioredoxin family protein [Marinilabiliaceae bacterium ANBcel2]
MSVEIKVLGTGCTKCKTLEKLTREVAEELQLDATITKVEDIMEIMTYNIASTPAVVVNEKVVVKGRLPSKDELVKQIKAETSNV